MSHTRFRRGFLALVALLAAALIAPPPSSGASTTSAEVPAATTSALSIGELRAIGVGYGHACGINAEATVYCWGEGIYGKLGNGATANADLPVPVTTAGTPLEDQKVEQVALGSRHSCALTSSDVVACWGDNEFHQLGDGGTTDSSVPVAVAVAGTALAGKDIVEIAVGYYFGCALASDGTVACWGSGSNGQLGNGSGDDQPVPKGIATAGTPLDGKVIEEIDAHGFNACAVTTERDLACWGSDSRGALGDGLASSGTVAVSPTRTGTPLDGATIDLLAVGRYHVCVTTDADVPVCWGNNESGELGDGTTTQRNTPVAVTRAGTPLDGAAITSLGTGPDATCATLGDGSVTCWGARRAAGQSEDALVAAALDDAGTVLDGATAIATEGGHDYGCALTKAGEAACWGFGALGAGDEITNTTMPVAVVLNGDVPGVPGTPSVVAEAASVHVTWDPPADDGGQPLTHHEVVAFVDGTIVDSQYAGASGPPSRLYDRLDPAETYTFAVVAHNVFGPGPMSAQSPPISPRAEEPDEPGLPYTPMTPCRIVDTRQAGGALGNREIRDVAVRGDGGAFAAQGGSPGGCDIPDEAVAVEASITAVGPATSGFFRAWPAGESMPNATFMNFDAGMDITNTGSITLGDEGVGLGEDLRIRNFGGASHYVIDIQGSFSPVKESGAGATASALPDAAEYRAMVPCRIVDTRQAGGALGNREIRDVAVRGDGGAFAAQGGNPGGCDIPDEAVAVEASITAVGPATSGFFRAWPAGESMPNATFMNFDAGMDITNTGSITLGAAAIIDGADTSALGEDLRIRNFGGASHYVIDIQGFYVPGPDEATQYRAITPCRIVDTRQAGGPLTNREIRTVKVAGYGPEFAAQGGKDDGCAIPTEARSVEVSITAVSPATSGFFRAWPASESMPNATFMNFDAGMDITNTGSIAIDELGLLDDEHMKIRNFGGTSHYVLDVQGYYAYPQ